MQSTVQNSLIDRVKINLSDKTGLWLRQKWPILGLMPRIGDADAYGPGSEVQI